MKHLRLIPLILFVTLFGCSQAPSGVDPKAHRTCLKAADYMGCLEMFSDSNSSSEKTLTPKEKKLLVEIKKLPARITRTSITDFQANVRDFVDAVSLAKFDQPESELVLNAEKLITTEEDNITFEISPGSAILLMAFLSRRSFLFITPS